MRSQCTVADSISFLGVGVHSGKPSEIVVKRADENTGIVFIRTDIDKNNLILASYKNVSDTMLCTTLTNEHGISVAVVEHLLAALRITGITNAVVEISGEEVPIMDGAAKEFVDAIKNVGVVKQKEVVKTIFIKDEIVVELGKGRIVVTPNDIAEIDMTFDSPMIEKVEGVGKHFVIKNIDECITMENLYSAKTFGLYSDYEKLLAYGKCKGTSCQNTIAIGDDGDILIEDGNGGIKKTALLDKNTFVLHKILDLIGDLCTAGVDIVGKFTCINTSHALNNKLVCKIMEKL